MVSFGQYHYRDSLLHRLDPRIKLAGVLLLSLFPFFIGEMKRAIFLTVFVFGLILIGKMPLERVWKGMRAFLPYFVFLLLIYIVVPPHDFLKGIITIWRFLILIIVSSILLFCTTISSLLAALEFYLGPLAILGIRPRNIAVMAATTIRFVPLLFEKVDRTKDAMVSRGADFRKIKHLKAFVGSLLGKAFTRANNLADAMYSRGYRDTNFTKYFRLKAGMIDFFSLAILALIVLGIGFW